MSSLISKIENMATVVGTDVHTLWEAFELFVEKEVGSLKSKPANDATVVESPIVQTVCPTAEETTPKE